VKNYLRAAKLLTWLPRIYFDDLTSNRADQVVFSKNLEKLAQHQNVVVYLHYSKGNELTVSEKKVLSNLKKSGFGICLVINADEPNEIYESKINEYLKKYSCTIIIRNNIGLDLGAYRDVANLLSDQGYWSQKKLVFMNNSVLWFPKKIAPYLSGLVNSDYDVFASSISKQYRQHIQTFLFGFTTVVGAKDIHQWLSSCKNWKLKQSVVSLGELSTNRFFRQKININSYPNFSQIVELSVSKLAKFVEFGPTTNRGTSDIRLEQNLIYLQSGVPQNNTHAYWLEIIELGFPGIKVDLIRNNPARIPDYLAAIECAIRHEISSHEISDLLLANRTSSRMIRVRSRLKI
jgi:hypothetical protein